MQRLVLWPLPLGQSSNQRSRAVHDKDAAIIAVLLLGHVSWTQADAEPFCELCCTVFVVSQDGVVVIGDRPLPVAAINEQQ